MFARLQQHRREQWQRRDYLLLRSWNDLSRRTPRDGRLVAFCGSSNLFWPYSMDRQLAEILSRRGEHDAVLNVGSFGFGDSSHVVSTLLTLREAYRQRSLDLLICELTPNEMPPLDSSVTRECLGPEARARLVVDHEAAAPIVQRLQQVQVPLWENLQRIAEIVRSQATPCPVLILDYESNLRQWPPTLSYFSRPLSGDAARQFERLLMSALVRLRDGALDRASEDLARCHVIDPDVSILAYLEAKVADARGDSVCASLYRRARDLDLLRGRLSRNRLMPNLEEWCDALGFWFISVPAIIERLTQGGIPGFDVFVDDVHYRPHVHFAVASAIVARLAAEGWTRSSAPAADQRDVLAAVDGQPSFILLQNALNLVMVPASPYNDERIAEGLRCLDEAARRKIDPALVEEYRLRFRLLAGDRDAAMAILEKRRARDVDPLAIALGLSDVNTASSPARSAGGGLSNEAVGPTITGVLLARFGVEMGPDVEGTDLLRLGVDSLGLAELVMTLEQLFDVTLDDRLLDRQVTCALLRDLIAARLVEQPARRQSHQRGLARQRALAGRRPRQLADLNTTPALVIEKNAAAGWDTRTIASVLTRHCREHANRIAVTVLPAGSRRADEALDWTWSDLDRASTDAARWLGGYGVSSGQVVHFLTGHSAFSISAIVAALRLGAVPSIGHAPSPKLSPEIFAETFGELVRRSAPTLIVVSPELESFVRRCLEVALDSHQRPMVVSSSSFDQSSGVEPHGSWVNADGTPDRLALLQHSSGTTGARKAVAFSDRSILRQVLNYARAIDLRRDDRIVSWLPLYHDMGLVACFLLPLLTATPVTMMSPFDWVTAPHLLFDAVTRDRGTLTWLPNFAFHLLAERVQSEHLTHVDLSSLRAVINCSEPIDLHSWQRFHDRFAFHGLSRFAHGTCYAMAENVFAVTQGGIGEPVYVDLVDATELRRDRRAVPRDPGVEHDQPMVAIPSSGTLVAGTRIRVVSADDRRTTLADRTIGEIEIASESLASGYYHNDEATTERFRAGWYRTGDRGYTVGEQVFVLGRESDVIIVAGVNLFADDIEQAVSRVPGVKPGRVAAFGVRDEHLGTDRPIVLFECAGNADATADTRTLRQAIQEHLNDSLQLARCDLVAVPAGAIRKTSSGKVARRRMKELFESGTFTTRHPSTIAREPMDTPVCGILLHQRPMLQDIFNVTHPIGWLFFSSWFDTPDEPITDQGLAEATMTVNGQNLLFLKALVDGRPEIINIELPLGETLTAERLLNTDRTICVHLSNDPASGFVCREARDVRILAPIRSWRIQSNGEAANGPTYLPAPA